MKIRLLFLSFFFFCINSVCSLASWQCKILGQTDFEPVMVKSEDNRLVKKYIQEVFVEADFSKQDLDLLFQDYKAQGLAENCIVLVIRDNSQIEPIAQDAKGYEKTCQDQILKDAVVVGSGIPLEGFAVEKSSKAVLAIKWSLIARGKK